MDVHDGGGTHKPGSHAVGVDTGGGLTDSGEKTSSSKSVSSNFNVCIWAIRMTSCFVYRRRSHPAAASSALRFEAGARAK